MNLTSTKIFRFEHFSKIYGNLWMGGTPAACLPNDAQFKQFHFIVSCYPWEDYQLHEHQVQTRAFLYDRNELPEQDLISALADYVNVVRKLGPTLVHCQQGWNRSGIIVALALVRSGMWPRDAIALMRENRSDEVLSNPVFERWILSQAPAEKALA